MHATEYARYKIRTLCDNIISAADVSQYSQETNQFVFSDNKRL